MSPISPKFICICLTRLHMRLKVHHPVAMVPECQEDDAARPMETEWTLNSHDRQTSASPFPSCLGKTCLCLPMLGKWWLHPLLDIWVTQISVFSSARQRSEMSVKILEEMHLFIQMLFGVHHHSLLWRFCQCPPRQSRLRLLPAHQEFLHEVVGASKAPKFEVSPVRLTVVEAQHSRRPRMRGPCTGGVDADQRQLVREATAVVSGGLLEPDIIYFVECNELPQVALHPTWSPAASHKVRTFLKLHAVVSETEPQRIDFVIKVLPFAWVHGKTH